MDKTMNQFNIDYSDERTWQLFQHGLTKCVFQCESKLVRHWLKLMKPNNIWELSAVIAAVRPGSLSSGMADDYVKYKNKEKEFQSFGNPIIDEILNSTYHVLLYQEQVLKLGTRLAWQHLPFLERELKADALRKAVGKKLQDKIMESGKDFVAGCIHNKISEEIANKLFDIIKNCGRYLFNLAHSVAYAYLAYETAYNKVKYPLQFISTYLTYAKYKLDKDLEIQDIFEECQKTNIEILIPNINSKNLGFKIENGKIRYGLSIIKNIGNIGKESIAKLPHINKWQQVIVLGLTDIYGIKLSALKIEALICSGAFSDTGMSRKSLLNVFNFFKSIKPREQSYLIEKFHECDTKESFIALIQECAQKFCNEKQRNLLLGHASSLNMNEFDHPAWIEEKETYYLSIPITATAVDLKNDGNFNSCKECYGDMHKPYEKKTLSVILNDIKIQKVKTGKYEGMNMAKLSVYDNTGKIDNIPIFPEDYIIYEHLLIPKNTISLTVVWGKKNWIANKILQI